MFVMSWAFMMCFVFALLVLLVTLAKCIAGAHYIGYLVFRPVLFGVRSGDLSCPVLCLLSTGLSKQTLRCWFVDV